LLFTHIFPTGLKNVPNDLAKTIATGIPTMEKNKPTIGKIVKIQSHIPKKTIHKMLKIAFHKLDMLERAVGSSTISCPKGKNKNDPYSNNPFAIGKPTIVMAKRIANNHTHIAFINPQNGMCQIIFPRVLIFSLIF